MVDRRPFYLCGYRYFFCKYKTATRRLDSTGLRSKLQITGIRTCIYFNGKNLYGFYILKKWDQHVNESGGLRRKFVGESGYGWNNAVKRRRRWRRAERRAKSSRRIWMKRLLIQLTGFLYFAVGEKNAPGASFRILSAFLFRFLSSFRRVSSSNARPLAFLAKTTKPRNA